MGKILKSTIIVLSGSLFKKFFKINLKRSVLVALLLFFGNVIGLTSHASQLLSANKPVGIFLMNKTTKKTTILSPEQTQQFKTLLDTTETIAGFNTIGACCFECFNDSASLVVGQINLKDSTMALNISGIQTTIFCKIPDGLANIINSAVVDSGNVKEILVIGADTIPFKSLRGIAFGSNGFAVPVIERDSTINNRLFYKVIVPNNCDEGNISTKLQQKGFFLK